MSKIFMRANRESKKKTERFGQIHIPLFPRAIQIVRVRCAIYSFESFLCHVVLLLLLFSLIQHEVIIRVSSRIVCSIQFHFTQTQEDEHHLAYSNN